MVRYAQIDIKTGLPVADSFLSGEVEFENMIRIDENFDLTNKKYADGKWIEYIPDKVDIEEEISENEIIQAEMLLNQESIIAKQNEHDEILAELLLGQQKGE